MFRFAGDAANPPDAATKEALRYRTALHQGFQLLQERPVSTAMAIEVCRTIKGIELDIRATPGTALYNEATGEVIYTPPEGRDLLRDKLSNWERYIHEAEDIDPLIRLAVMHYQFEAIHPFSFISSTRACSTFPCSISAAISSATSEPITTGSSG